MSQKNLSYELQNLINPEPTFEDPEDDGNIDTSNKWFQTGTDENKDEIEAPAISKIRKKQVSYLSSLNKRYIGKKVSRNDLASDDDDDQEPEEDDEYSGEEEEEDEQSDENELNESENEKDDEELESDFESDQMDMDDDVQSDAESDLIQRSASANGKVDTNDEINILNFDADKQMSKASAVKNQLLIYDNLLETRIKFQKLLASINRLPQGSDFTAVKSFKSALLSELMDECSKGVRRLGKLLLEIDTFLECEEKEAHGPVGQSPNKRKCVNFDEASLSKRFCELSSSYRPIIESWHERTKFVHANIKLKKFDSFDICPTKSIDQILTNKERLINRTRVKRSAFKIIGQTVVTGSKGEEEDAAEDNQDQSNNDDNYNEEIYDDDDFYHQLLRQIIENKIGELDDSTAMSKKYMEIQRMRNKLKKQVDTKASKGRKIRYDVHEKLVNFMAPVDTTTMPDEAKNELFKSLFGNFSSNMMSDD